MKAIVAGGSGYIGAALVASLRADGHEVVVVSRSGGEGQFDRNAVDWDGVGAAVEGADAVFNLSGTPIAPKRWTGGRKESIRSSRVGTTLTLVRAIEAAEAKPRVLVVASGIDYFGDSGDTVVDESSPPGKSFLARVCAHWEAAAARAPVRNVSVRTSFVVGPGASSVSLMALPFRLFAGGPLGGGRQWFPWIHLEDLVRIYRHAADTAALEGPLDAVAPELLRQRDVARVIGEVLNRPAVLPTPAFAMRLLLGEEADLLLHGQRAVSRKLDGFEFRYRGVRAAFEDALG